MFSKLVFKNYFEIKEQKTFFLMFYKNKSVSQVVYKKQFLKIKNNFFYLAKLAILFLKYI